MLVNARCGKRDLCLVAVSKPLPPPYPAPKPAAPSERRETLAEAIQRYTWIIGEAKSLKTASACRYALEHGHQWLIFPNPRTGRPEGHFVRKLKNLARRAGTESGRLRIAQIPEELRHAPARERNQCQDDPAAVGALRAGNHAGLSGSG